MKSLEEYTSDELREELKRRAILARKNKAPYEIIYKEFEATISYVDNILFKYSMKKPKLKNICLWKYRIKDCTEELPNRYQYIDYVVKQGAFRKDEMPKVGDRVKLKYRRTKKSVEIFDLRRAKIIEIIKQ